MLFGLMVLGGCKGFHSFIQEVGDVRRWDRGAVSGVEFLGAYIFHRAIWAVGERVLRSENPYPDGVIICGDSGNNLRPCFIIDPSSEPDDAPLRALGMDHFDIATWHLGHGVSLTVIAGGIAIIFLYCVCKCYIICGSLVRSIINLSPNRN